MSVLLAFALPNQLIHATTVCGATPPMNRRQQGELSDQVASVARGLLIRCDSGPDAELTEYRKAADGLRSGTLNGESLAQALKIVREFIAEHDPATCLGNGLYSTGFVCPYLSGASIRPGSKDHERIDFDGYVLERYRQPTRESKSDPEGFNPTWRILRQNGEVLGTLGDTNGDGKVDTLKISGAWEESTRWKVRRSGYGSELPVNDTDYKGKKLVVVPLVKPAPNTQTGPIYPKNPCDDPAYNPVALLRATLAEQTRIDLDGVGLSAGTQFRQGAVAAGQGYQQGAVGEWVGGNQAADATWEGAKLAKNLVTEPQKRAALLSAVGNAMSAAGQEAHGAYDDCVKKNPFTVPFCLNEKLEGQKLKLAQSAWNAVWKSADECLHGKPANDYPDGAFSECMGSIAFKAIAAATGGATVQALKPTLAVGAALTATAAEQAAAYGGQALTVFSEWVLGASGNFKFPKAQEALEAIKSALTASSKTELSKLSAAEAQQLTRHLEALATHGSDSSVLSPELRAKVDRAMGDGKLANWEGDLRMQQSLAPDVPAGARTGSQILKKSLESINGEFSQWEKLGYMEGLSSTERARLQKYLSDLKEFASSGGAKPELEPVFRARASSTLPPDVLESWETRLSRRKPGMRELYERIDLAGEEVIGLAREERKLRTAVDEIKTEHPQDVASLKDFNRRLELASTARDLAEIERDNLRSYTLWSTESPNLERLHARKTTPGREQILKDAWEQIDASVSSDSGRMRVESLADHPKVIEGRMGGSSTIQKDPAAATSWKQAESSMRRWMRDGKPIDSESIQTLNSMLIPENSANGLVRGTGEDLSIVGAGNPTKRKLNMGAGVTPDETMLPKPGAGKYQRIYLPSEQVPAELEKFTKWLQTAETDIARKQRHPISVAAEAYERLVSIHPFQDGNGRTCRMVMDWILMKHGYPPPILTGRRKSVAVFDDWLSENLNISAKAAEVRVTQGIREAMKLTQ